MPVSGSDFTKFKFKVYLFLMAKKKKNKATILEAKIAIHILLMPLVKHYFLYAKIAVS